LITLALSPEVLGRTRFSFSPLTETTMSLRLLGRPRPTFALRPWLHEARDRLADVDLELLLSVVPPGPYIPSFLVPPGPVADPSLEDQLSALTHLSADDLREHLQELWGDRPMPRRVVQLLAEGPRAASVLVEALWGYWDAAIRPFWPRMCAVLEDDVSYRMAGLVEGGYFALLKDLHPEITVVANQMRVNKPHFSDSVPEAQEMTLTPSVFAWPDLVLEDGGDGRLGLTYAARGIARVWERGRTSTTQEAEGLGALIGRTRAAILRSTTVPMSTTHIARELGQSMATVSEHLIILRDAGLVTSRRSGRSVLYRQTPLAEYIIRMQQDFGQVLRSTS
jgi:DNA-binding transcriptional ArsR family regulator